jgi:hypothetical protein
MRTLNRIANQLFGMLFSWTLGQRITDTLCGTKVLFRDDYRKIAARRAELGDFDPFGDFELLFGAARLNRKIVEVPVRYEARTYGEVKIRRWQHGVLLVKTWWAAFRVFRSAGSPAAMRAARRGAARARRFHASRAVAAPVGLPRSHRNWCAACVAGIALAVGARVGHYALSVPPALDAMLSWIVRSQIWALMGGFVLMIPCLLIGLVVLALLAMRREWCMRREGGRWAFRPFLHSLAWTGLLLFNPTFDVDRYVTLTSVPALALVFPFLIPPLAARIRSLAGKPQRYVAAAFAAWTAAAALTIVRAPPEISALLLAGWLLLLLGVLALEARSLATRDACWLGLGSLAALQFFNAFRLEPLDPAAVRIGDKGYAYTFCELPERQRLYAAVPCDGSRRCPRGYVAEHDTRDPAKHLELQLFDASFQGRLVHLVCFDDTATVQVGMSNSVIGGRKLRESVVEFSAVNPSIVQRNLFDGDVGSRLAWDRRHDAIFYSSEFSRRLFRYDRRTGTVDRDIAARIYGPGTDSNAFGSHLVENDAFHAGRNSIFIGQWLSGSRVFELDLASLELRATYDAYHGGNHGLAVDDELDRLWVTGVWGVDVLEIPSGKRLSNAFLGLGARLPVIDRRHDLVYIPTTSARLWVLDRRSFELLGSIHVGGGSRNPYLSADGKRLFVSALRGYSYWETDELARRFGRAGR